MIGLMGIVTPKIYYHYNQIPIQPFTSQVSEKTVVHKVVSKNRVKSNKLVIPIVTPETKKYIDDIFGENAKIATATLMHESGLILDNIGYNCHYYNKDGKKYSTSCRIEDRPKAWSVDCGIAQINVKGKVCPSKLLTLEGNMEAVEKIYKEQGLNAWYSYKNGYYKKFLQ